MSELSTNSLREFNMRTLLVKAAVAAALCLAASASLAAETIPDKPLSLDDCVSIALAKNPQLISSEQQVVSARASLTRARSDYYPQLSLAATEGLVSRSSAFSTDTTAGSSGSDTRQQLDLTARMTLWRHGRQESVAQSAASLQAATWDHSSAIQSLISEVARNYYAVLAARQLVGVAEAGVESAQLHLEQVKARVAIGVTAEVEVFPAEDDLARARLDLIDARGALRSAFAQLKNSLGLSPETTLDLSEAALPEAQQIPSLKESLQLALAHRPEMLAGDASLRVSRYALTQARLRRGPLPEVGGEYAKGYSDWEARDPSWSLLLSLSWPLFDGRATEADVTSAQASARRSEADLQRVTNQVGLEVENAVVDLERTQERLTATAKSVQAAEARLAAAEGKYRQGVGILLEVIDARVAVTTARATQVRARYDYQTALVELQRAMGTLAAPQSGDAP